MSGIRLVLLGVLSVFVFQSQVYAGEAMSVVNVTGLVDVDGSQMTSEGDRVPSGSKLLSEDGDSIVLADNQGAVVKTVPCPVCFKNKASVENTSADKRVLGVYHGGLLVNLEPLKKGQSFEVKTPNAVASVRGTAFWAHVNHEGSEFISVAEGSVKWDLPGSESVVLNAGETYELDVVSGISELRATSRYERDTIAQVL